MKKEAVVTVLLGILLGGCGNSDTAPETTQGVHFQGRDCLACHNTDLSEDKHLYLGGTLFKSASNNPDGLNNVCGGTLYVQFLNEAYEITYTTASDQDRNSSGRRGKGNFYVLKRDHTPIAGAYYMQIINDKGVTLAQSNTLHQFNTDPYTPQSATDFSNRYSCNACHTDGGITAPLYTQFNPSQCQ